MNQRLKDASKLIKSKCYILITDKEGIVAGDLRGLSGLMKVATLQSMVKQTEKIIKSLQTKGVKANGRKQSGRPKSSPSKQTKTRR